MTLYSLCLMQQSISERDIGFMMEALKEADIAAEKGNYGIGAVVVHNDKIVSRSGNEIITRGRRQYAHAEFLALEKIRDTDLYLPENAGELMVYTTLGPCPQCWGHMMVNGIGRIVYGAGDEISTQNFQTSVPQIFESPTREIVELGGDLGRRCLDTFLKSAASIDAILGHKR